MKKKALILWCAMVIHVFVCSSGHAAEVTNRASTSSRSSAADLVLEADKNIAIANKNTLLSFQNKNYVDCVQWAQRYFKEGGADIQIRRILSQCYFNISDYVNAAREIQAEMLFADRNGKVLDEDRLNLLLKSYVALNDPNAQSWVLEKLLVTYSKKIYWSSLLTITQRRPDFRKNLSLDVQRLKFATSTLLDPLDYFEMAQNALNLGFATEARSVLDQGISSKVLIQSLDSSIYLQLRSEIKRKIEEERREIAKFELEVPSTSNAISMMNIGMSLVQASEFEKGLSLMERAVSVVGSRDRPQDARLHLAIAYFKAGKKSKALETLALVSGVHGAADLARLWAIYVKNESP